MDSSGAGRLSHHWASEKSGSLELSRVVFDGKIPLKDDMGMDQYLLIPFLVG